ncbi:MAG TPA: hypothetical protein ENI70_01875 [Candidatus Peregrinibacteria bacterium]|nr:hypothetical protein [Candidatus Peregrinibacteria bacterium]
MKKIFLLAVVFTLLLTGCLTKDSSQSGATLRVVLDKNTVSAGDSVNAKLLLDTDEKLVTTAKVFLTYNAEVLEITEEGIDLSNSAFSINPFQEIKSNQIELVLGKPYPGVEGVVEIANLSFKALKSANTSLNFNSQLSVVLSESKNILTKRESADLEIK